MAGASAAALSMARSHARLFTAGGTKKERSGSRRSVTRGPSRRPSRSPSRSRQDPFEAAAWARDVERARPLRGEHVRAGRAGHAGALEPRLRRGRALAPAESDGLGVAQERPRTLLERRW